MQRLDQKIDIIVLDVHTREKFYADFHEKSANEKIQHFSEVIEEAMKQFEQKSDNNMKIFVWREHAISDPNSKFSNNETRKILKVKMQELAKRYPNICIIAGTIATKKEINNYTLKHYEEIEKAYSDPILTDSRNHVVVSSQNKTKPTQASLHYTQLEKTKNMSKVTVVFNSCYVFQGENTYRRDKLVPFHETEEKHKKNKQINMSGDIVFRPGVGKTAHPFITIINTNTNQPLVIGIEICIEHKKRYLMDVMDRRNFTEKPMIHFVISDAVHVDPNSICANYFMYVDSHNKPRLVVMDTTENQQVNYYQINALLMLRFIMKGPLEEIHVNPHELYDAVMIFAEMNIRSFDGENDNFSKKIKENFEEIRGELKLKGDEYKQNESLLTDLLHKYEAIFQEELDVKNKSISELSSKIFDSNNRDILNKEREGFEKIVGDFKKLAEYGPQEVNCEYSSDAKEKIRI